MIAGLKSTLGFLLFQLKKNKKKINKRENNKYMYE